MAKIIWKDSLDDAIKEAKEEKRLLLIDFFYDQ